MDLLAALLELLLLSEVLLVVHLPSRSPSAGHWSGDFLQRARLVGLTVSLVLDPLCAASPSFRADTWVSSLLGGESTSSTNTSWVSPHLG